MTSTGPARDALVTELKGGSIAHINGFQRKLSLISFARYPTSLPKLSEVLKDVPERGKHFSKYKKDLETLQQQFTTRFQDLVALQPRLTLFTDPLAAVPSQQPPDSQIELCASSNFVLEAGTPRPGFQVAGISIASVFGSTYLCEKAFPL